MEWQIASYVFTHASGKNKEMRNPIFDTVFIYGACKRKNMKYLFQTVTLTLLIADRKNICHMD